MNAKSKWASVIFIATSANTFAAGVVDVSGTVDSFTQEKVILKLATGDRVTVSRKAVPQKFDLAPGKSLSVQIAQKDFDKGLELRPRKAPKKKAK